MSAGERAISARALGVRGRRWPAALRAPVAALLCALAAAALGAPTPAGADLFGPISLVSEGTVGGGRPQQAEYAHDAAISGNGQYVAFDGSVGGVTGVWRRDIATGATEQVAGGDAELPSISESGRYVSFTSTEDLVPEDEARGPNVWVRDMEPAGGEPEYILASAVNGSTKGLTYEYGSDPQEEERRYGSVATGRSAISANGQEVAFVTTAVSNLLTPHTPALQVAVRYLRSEQTVLVSGEYDAATGQTSDEPVSVEEAGRTYGAVYPGVAAHLGFEPVPADGYWAEDPSPGASISADGSTVAWLGEDIDRQAPMLSGEHASALYTEPLWRRIAPGSETPTERVTGGSEPGNPACLASGETVLPAFPQSASDPCQGPFQVELTSAEGRTRGIWSEEGGSGTADFVPRLSGDGYKVAFVSSALPTGLGRGFGNEGDGEPPDLYIADMHPGLTRWQALTPLTRVGGLNTAADSPITDFDISPGGEQVAFTTRRSELLLGSPAYVSVPAAEPGESELFDVDLADDTLTRVTHGYEGGPSEQAHGSKIECPGAEDVYCEPITIGAQSPSFSADGRLIAFSSTASNLVFGDGNGPPFQALTRPHLPDGSDAFLVERQTFVALPTPQYISEAPPQPPSEPLWRLGVTALSRSDGSVVLYVQAPGAGTLRAGAQSAVVVQSAAHPARRARRAAGARGHASAAKAAAPAHETVATRTVASAGAITHEDGGGLVTLVLNLAKPYAALAARDGGLTASVSLSFTAAGHPALHGSIAVGFLRSAPRKRTSSEAKGAAGRRRKRR